VSRHYGFFVFLGFKGGRIGESSLDTGEEKEASEIRPLNTLRTAEQAYRQELLVKVVMKLFIHSTYLRSEEWFKSTACYR
jgi:hypothetical protein